MGLESVNMESGILFWLFILILKDFDRKNMVYPINFTIIKVKASSSLAVWCL